MPSRRPDPARDVAEELVAAREAVVEWINGLCLRGAVRGPAFVIGVDELAAFVARYAAKQSRASRGGRRGP